MSKALLAIGFVSMLWGNLALAAYQDEVLADNPVAYYRFEETSGTTAFDTTANSNNGTYTNGVLINQSGAASLGKAARFDGIDDYVSTPRTVSTSFTLELWINTTASSFTGTQAFEGNGLLWSDVGGPANDFVMAMLNNGLVGSTIQRNTFALMLHFREGGTYGSNGTPRSFRFAEVGPLATLEGRRIA